MTTLDDALQTTIASMKAYVSGLSPEAMGAFQAGLHASHFEEALAQGDWDRAAVHAKALGKLAPAAHVMEVSSGSIVRWAPAETTAGFWDSLSTDDQRTILHGAAPIPGLIIAKLLGAAWPVAGAAGLLSAPLMLWLGIMATTPKPAQQTGAPKVTLGPKGR
jgi:phytoene/squalene synthetase